ncbi:hypothetical protein KCP70_13425 [Salmonella enterica subsp. enterica]|nr:hypothetical protein KCP70_13425 [Salmonella enterica subsp. enterica]
MVATLKCGLTMRDPDWGKSPPRLFMLGRREDEDTAPETTGADRKRFP